MISRPLASASLRPIVLSLLQRQASYGYALIQGIRDLSDGELAWTTGTLYPFLHGLENDGLVESFWQEVTGAPRRKYYRLTPAGERALAAEKQQWIDVTRMLVRLWGSTPDLSLA